VDVAIAEVVDARHRDRHMIGVGVVAAHHRRVRVDRDAPDPVDLGEEPAAGADRGALDVLGPPGSDVGGVVTEVDQPGRPRRSVTAVEHRRHRLTRPPVPDHVAAQAQGSSTTLT
jgi:hypothetical protein